MSAQGTGARERIEAARMKIVAELDRVQQKIANLDEGVRKAMAEANSARAEEIGLRTALDALGPKPTRDRSKANGAAKKPPKPPREASDARQRTLATAATRLADQPE